MQKVKDHIIQYAKSVPKFKTSDAVKALGGKYSRVYVSRALNDLHKKGNLLRAGSGAHIYYALPGSAGLLFHKSPELLSSSSLVDQDSFRSEDKSTTPFKLKDATAQDLFEISLESAKAKSKSVFIYEKGDLNDVIGEKKAEELRDLFLANNIKVKQITNIPTLPPFSKNDRFINTCMTFRYIPEETFTIEKEILIFDDTVAIYTIGSNPKLAVIEDKSFAANQKQLFLNLWDQGQPPILGFDYKPNHSWYRNFDYKIWGKHVVCYPDKDAVDSYRGFNYESLGEYLESVLDQHKESYKDADYLIIFIWNLEGNKMMDVWKMNANYVDDRSGPLGAVKVYKDGKECSDLEVASGNTLLILGYEEKLRRQAPNLEAYFNGPPAIPLELVNRQNFFEAMEESEKKK